MRASSAWIAIGMMYSAMSFAQVSTQPCEKDLIHIPEMGMVTSKHLQEHIDQLQPTLEQVQRQEAPSSAHRKMVEDHMDDMLKAQKSMTNASVENPCGTANKSNNTLEARVQNLENKIAKMQRLLEQLSEKK